MKHFNQRSKLKSVMLRKELLDRASDAAKHNLKKIPAPTIPLRTRGMPRKMTDTSETISYMLYCFNCTPAPAWGRHYVDFLSLLLAPLKGIPSLPSANRIAGAPTSMPPSRTSVRPGAEKKGGIKMLDITEQPMGFGPNKRRRKATGNNDHLVIS